MLWLLSVSRTSCIWVVFSSLLFVVFPIPNITRTQIHSLCQCPASWSKTQQFASQCKLWPKSWRFWACKDNIWNRFHDRVCCNTVVSCTGVAPKLFRIHSSNWYLVSWLHTGWDDDTTASLSWQGLRSPVETYHRGKYALCVFVYLHKFN